MKKIFALILTLVLALSFASCTKEDTTSTETEKTYKIGIIQYMSHPSLDNCYKGIINGLDEQGIKYEVDYQTGSSNSADSDCANFAKNMVSSNYDMIFAIATPAAISAFQATADTEIPVVFCSVSDPVAAKLVKTLENPGYLCTGTSDVLDLEAQVDLIQNFQKDVKKIGVLYTASEVNSISNLKVFEEVCGKRNIEVVAKSVQGASDIPSAADELASQVDCINNFTDNNVVNNLQVVLSAAEKYGIYVYGSEVEQVKNGCFASASIDYVAVGKETGVMGAKVLGGEDISKMAVKVVSDTQPVVNKDLYDARQEKVDAPSGAEFVETNK